MSLTSEFVRFLEHATSVIERAIAQQTPVSYRNALRMSTLSSDLIDRLYPDASRAPEQVGRAALVLMDAMERLAPLLDAKPDLDMSLEELHGLLEEDFDA